ncbi:MAG: tetratricopeptide repeat protein [Thiotrichaceae bacterium]
MKKQHYSLAALLFVVGVNLYADSPVDHAEECEKLVVEGSSKQAIFFCTKASESGSSASQTLLGEIYDELGDSKKTLFWWEKAANSGYQPARNLLALKYYYGGTIFGPEEGWGQDFAKAFKIWEQDAKNEVATSQFMIGVMYHKGEGVEKSLSNSWFWLKRSLGNGYKLATDVLIEVSREITPEQKQSGEKMLVEYSQQKTKKGI